MRSESGLTTYKNRIEAELINRMKAVSTGYAMVLASASGPSILTARHGGKHTFCIMTMEIALRWSS